MLLCNAFANTSGKHRNSLTELFTKRFPILHRLSVGHLSMSSLSVASLDSLSAASLDLAEAEPCSAALCEAYWITCPNCLEPTPKCRFPFVGSYKLSGRYGVDPKRVVTFCNPRCQGQLWLPPISDTCGYMRFTLKLTEAQIRTWRSEADRSLGPKPQMPTAAAEQA